MRKQIQLLGLGLLMAFWAGCSTPSKVATMEGRGHKQVYNAPFDQVWNAALASAEQGGRLKVVSSDKASGYIAAKRGLRVNTFGENVGLWVRPAGPNQTEVEVVSRQAGPPVAWFKNWENEILASINQFVTVGSQAAEIRSAPAGAATTPEPILQEPIR